MMSDALAAGAVVLGVVALIAGVRALVMWWEKRQEGFSDGK